MCGDVRLVKHRRVPEMNPLDGGGVLFHGVLYAACWSPMERVCIHVRQGYRCDVAFLDVWLHGSGVGVIPAS